MTTRHQYRLELSTFSPTGHSSPPDNLDIRSQLAEELDKLADLMLDAYRGTRDYDNETLEDARQEVPNFINGNIGIPLLEYSKICLHERAVISACLLSIWDEIQLPLVSYVMTGAAWKGRSLAGVLLNESLFCIITHGYSIIHAFITQGNTLSEMLFSRAQFQLIS